MEYGKVRKVGNSLVVTIPKERADELDIREGDLVAFEVRKATAYPALPPHLEKISEQVWKENEEGLRYLAEH